MTREQREDVIRTLLTDKELLREQNRLMLEKLKEMIKLCELFNEIDSVEQEQAYNTGMATWYSTTKKLLKGV